MKKEVFKTEINYIKNPEYQGNAEIRAYELLYSIIGDPFNSEEKDLMVLALILHDGLKHGEPKEEYVRFDHPLLAAEFIKENKNNTTFKDSEIEFLSSVISSHMGPFNTNKYSDKVLPKPQNKYQKFVHMCDLLASKKFLDIKFENNEIVDQGGYNGN